MWLGGWFRGAVGRCHESFDGVLAIRLYPSADQPKAVEAEHFKWSCSAELLVHTHVTLVQRILAIHSFPVPHKWWSSPLMRSNDGLITAYFGSLLM